jgi:hypothetical protein
VTYLEYHKCSKQELVVLNIHWLGLLHNLEKVFDLEFCNVLEKVQDFYLEYDNALVTDQDFRLLSPNKVSLGSGDF